MKDCQKCENYRWLIENDKLIPCRYCNHSGVYEAKTITICLGCGCDIMKRDCGCPAGTQQQLLKYTPEDPEPKDDPVRYVNWH